MAKDLKRKKKKWYPILAPKLFNNVLIGETFVADPSLVVGRMLKTNLSNLSGNIRHQSLNLKFLITRVEDNTARTQTLGIEMSPASIKRLVRRNTNRMDSSFTAETSDKKRVRVKPLLLTRYKTRGVVIKTLREEMKKSMVNEINKLTYENLIKALVSHSLQREMKTKLKKIYPIRTLEVKKLELEKEGREKHEKEEVKKEVKEEEKQEVKEKVKEETKEETKEKKDKKQTKAEKTSKEKTKTQKEK